MADNVQLPIATSAGAVIGTDEVVISTVTVHIPLNKLGYGTGGVYNPVATGQGLPVSFVNAIPAGTSTIGNVNLSTGGAVFLKTSTGGVIPADTTSGLAVKFVNAQSIYLQTSTGGTIPADTTSGIHVKFTNQTVQSTLQAGTATIGTVNIQGTVSNIQPGTASDDLGKRVDDADGGTSVGVMFIGVRDDKLSTGGVSADGDYDSVKIDNRGALYINPYGRSAQATGNHGPKSVNLTATTSGTLVTAAGSGNSYYITSISASNRATTGVTLNILDGANTRYSMRLAAAEGGGFIQYFDPPFQTASAGTLAGSLATAAGDVLVNVHFFEGPK